MNHNRDHVMNVSRYWAIVHLPAFLHAMDKKYALHFAHHLSKPHGLGALAAVEAPWKDPRVARRRANIKKLPLSLAGGLAVNIGHVVGKVLVTAGGTSSSRVANSTAWGKVCRDLF